MYIKPKILTGIGIKPSSLNRSIPVFKIFITGKYPSYLIEQRNYVVAGE
jgi:hypothetical protein